MSHIELLKRIQELLIENKKLRQEIEWLRWSNNVISENMKKFKYDNVRLREENSKLIKQCWVPK